MSAPTITGLTSISVTEGDAAIAIDQGVSFAGGAAFAGGAIRFSVASPTAGDQFTIGNAADPNASGAISVAGGVVYLGNGATRDAIGSVDAIENGQNGQALKINLGVDTGVINNPSFETDLSGWTIGQDRVILGQTVLNGWTTPNDPTIPPNAGDDAGGVSFMTYTAVRATDQFTAGSASLRLFNQGSTQAGFDVVHGPYAISNTFAATTGDVFTFDWRAAAGGDAYDAFAYLMNAADGSFQIVVNETGADPSGQKPWTATSVVVPTDGQYFFVFVAGTYDFTGGQGVGGSLYVDNLRNLTSDADDATLKAITQAVLFQGTSDNPAAGARNLTIGVTDSVGASSSATSTITIQNVNDAPTGAVAIGGTVAEGQTLTATNTIVDPDGNGAVSYQWQIADGNGGWTNIGGATNATYQPTTGNIGSALRVVASYTDGGGTAETVISPATAAVVNTNDAPTGAVSITGTATQGQVLTASNTLADADGLGPIAYRWQAEGAPGVWTDIAGATGANFTTTQAQVGHAVRAVARYTDGFGTVETVASAATTAVANVNDAPTGAVSIRGSTVMSDVLTAQNSIGDLDGFNPAGLTYQWQRSDGAGGWNDIAGATDAQYKLARSDLESMVRVVVRYTDGEGTAESLTSAPTSTVVEDFPTPPTTVPPTLPSAVFDGLGNTSLGTASADTMSGLGGDDQISGGLGDDHINGNQGDDVLYGNQGEDTLHGGQNNDIVRGGQDNDVVFGDAGNDYVFGDLGNDRVFGGEGDDYANGNAGADTVDGGAGNDTVQGGRGDDVVLGGDGNDVVMGDFGADTLTGGAGADLFNLQGGGADRITDFDGAAGDRILLDAGSTWTVAQVGADAVVTWTGGTVVLANVQAANLAAGWII